MKKEESRNAYDSNPRGTDLPEHAYLDQLYSDVEGPFAMATNNAEAWENEVSQM
jgi:hypothetical protein